MILQAESCNNLARVGGILCRLWAATDSDGRSYYLFVALLAGPEGECPDGFLEAMVPVEEAEVKFLPVETP